MIKLHNRKLKVTAQKKIKNKRIQIWKDIRETINTNYSYKKVIMGDVLLLFLKMGNKSCIKSDCNSLQVDFSYTLLLFIVNTLQEQ